MKLITICEIVLCGILVFGCAETAKEESLDKSMINEQLVTTLNDIQVKNAIVAQHTLYPYHFTANSKKLNELGQRDFAVLAQFFQENPGPLNVRRNDVSEEIYQARVALVLENLKQAGIDMKRITVSDDMPGGAGMTSERILTILEPEEETSARGSRRTGTGFNTRSRR